MKDKKISNGELEKEFERNFKFNELKKNVFKILRDEKSSLELKERSLKKKF